MYRNRKFNKSYKSKAYKNLDRRIKRLTKEAPLSFADFYENGSAITLPLFTLLNPPAPLYALKSTLTSIQVRGYITTQAVMLGPSYVRIIVVYDSTAVPAAINLSTSTAGFDDAILDDSTVTNITLAPYDLRQGDKRFKILFDKTIVINPNDLNAYNTATGVTTQSRSKNIKFKFKKSLNRYQEFNPAANLIAGGLAVYYIPEPVRAGEYNVFAGWRVIYKYE